MSAPRPRDETIPYARPFWDGGEAEELLRVLDSGTWTNGPAVARFEQALREATGAVDIACVSNGTTALYAILHLLRPVRGRALMVTSSLNFAAAASCALLTNHDIALTDIEPATLNMSPESLDAVLKASARDYDHIVVIPVHFAGLPVDMEEILRVAKSHGALVVEDACHAIGGRYEEGGRPVGSHPETQAAVFSFHPTKPVASGEGGAVAVNDEKLARRVRAFRTHNMQRDELQNHKEAFDPEGRLNPWYYEIQAPALNFRLSEFHAAVGIAQVRRLPQSLARRGELARRYRALLGGVPGLTLFPEEHDPRSGLHLFPVALDLDRLQMTRRAVFEHFAAREIRLQVHYVPLHQQPAFASAPLVRARAFPALDSVARRMLSLPLYNGLTEEQQDRVISALRELKP